MEKKQKTLPGCVQQEPEAAVVAPYLTNTRMHSLSLLPLVQFFWFVFFFPPAATDGLNEAQTLKTKWELGGPAPP